jgi:hypothetical protein
MGLYWMPRGTALAENATVWLPCDRLFQATEASHPPLPTTYGKACVRSQKERVMSEQYHLCLQGDPAEPKRCVHH